MKPCTYCGRENEDTATHCSECGTEIPATTVETKPGPLLNPGTLKTFLTLVGVMFLATTLYLLSFGPVFRWTATVTTTPASPAMNTTSSNGATIFMSESITYPIWVGVVYYPAVSLMYGNAGMFSDLYHRYIEWWEKPSP